VYFPFSLAPKGMFVLLTTGILLFKVFLVQGLCRQENSGHLLWQLNFYPMSATSP
jgi:hypothetical protein